LLGIQRGLFGFGLHLGVDRGTLRGKFGINDPAGHRERDRPGELLGILAHGDSHPDQLLLVERSRFDHAQPLARLVQRLGADRCQIDRAGRHFVHLRFAVKLSGRQVAGRGCIASADADQFAQGGQSAAEDGDGEDDLQQ
jgi:hypothetical protein